MKPILQKRILKIQEGNLSLPTDQLAVEEPLEIQLAYWENQQLEKVSLSITMRTPGADESLALGFLYAEGIIESMDEVAKIAHLPSWDADFSDNRIVVGLHQEVSPNLEKLRRHFYTNSSCGVCGKASIEAINLDQKANLPKGKPLFKPDIIQQLPDILRKQQAIFAHTGGIHAAALFNTQGELLLLEEDVGRHNAVDKVIGMALQSDLFPLHDYLLQVSGRTSFELVQKALMAEIPILSAVGAPSSLAVQLAESADMTLLGFVKPTQFNIYSGSERIILD